LSQQCSLADWLLNDASTQAFGFIVNTCLSERATASEIFTPVSAVERLGGRVAVDQWGENLSGPAVVPSIFHQRTTYLSLDLFQSLLFSLLRVASSPTWLSHAASATQVPGTSSGGREWPTTPSVFGLQQQGAALGPSDGARMWAAVMDVVLEGARRIVEVLESLHSKKNVGLLLSVGQEQGNATVPLSLSLAALEPGEEGDLPTFGGDPQSPGILAKGLTPPATPRSPPWKSTSKRTKPPHALKTEVIYKHLALRSHGTFGGQISSGILPEYVSLAEMRRLCGSILEMACNLLYDFCKASHSNADHHRSVSSVSVLRGLYNFLRELKNKNWTGIDDDTKKFLLKFYNQLRSDLQLGEADEDIEDAAASAGGDADEFSLEAPVFRGQSALLRAFAS